MKKKDELDTNEEMPLNEAAIKILVDNFWGGHEDLAQEVEAVYESKYGKSAVLWCNEDEPISSAKSVLEGRGEDKGYNTCGYTKDFEAWGQRKVEESVRAGNIDYCDIVDFIRNNPDS